MPIKRVKEMDSIFETVHEENEKSDQRPDSLWIFIDTKAKVDVAPFFRRGQSRGDCAGETVDHDFKTDHKLEPFGILNVQVVGCRSFSGPCVRPAISFSCQNPVAGSAFVG